jgi:stage IV sporulation protein A
MSLETREVSQLIKRLNGSLVVAVTGPTKTGKSLFILKVLETFVIPRLEKKIEVELPISESGRTITTMQTCLFPLEKVNINIEEDSFEIQFIDCIGYKAHGVRGFHNENGPVKLKLEGYDKHLHYKHAISLQTREIVSNIANVTIVVTTDGTIDDLPSYAFIDAENELLNDIEITRPKVMIMNSTKPRSEETIELARSLEEKYKIPVIPMSVAELTEDQVISIFKIMYNELPVLEVNINLPEWFTQLEEGHFFRVQVENVVRETMKKFSSIGKIPYIIEEFKQYDFIEDAIINTIDGVNGFIEIELIGTEEVIEKFTQNQN